MKKFTISEIVKATNGQLVQGREDDYVLGFSIDSREINPDQMFFAIEGKYNDGHDYIEQVISKGCKNLLVSNMEKTAASKLDDVNVVLVDDTTVALQQLAKWYLNSLPLKKKIGVTGSVGKTSTRDMMYFVANTKYVTGRNKKNYNNGHGLPLSILEFPEDTEIAVLEMGMDSLGEIEFLAELVRPDVAIITTIAEVNILKMKNLDNILKAKMEITKFFNETSTLVVNSSCPMLCEEKVGGAYNLVKVSEDGEGEQGEYVVKNIVDYGDKGIRFTVCHGEESHEIVLPVAGAHNALNASLAIAVGQMIGITPAEAAEGLKNAELTGKRLKVTERNGIKIIDDTYNACEDSIKSAVNTLAATDAKRRVAIIGDVLGLVERAEAVHRSIGAHVAAKDIDILIAVGEDAFYCAEEAKKIMGEERVKYFTEKDDFISVKDDIIKVGDVVMVKASRGMEMEKIVNKL